jgi:hypothetical protein
MNNLYLKLLDGVECLLTNEETVGLLLNLSKYIKLNYKCLKYEFCYFYNVLIPYKRLFLKLDKYFPDDLEKSELKISQVQKLLKINNFEEYILSNLYLLAIYLYYGKNYDACEVVAEKLIDVFYRNKRELFFYDNEYKRSSKLDLFFDLLKFKSLQIYLLIKGKIVTKDGFTEVLSLYRKGCINNELSNVLLINFITKYYIDNKAFQQAKSFLSKAKYDFSVSEKQNMRFYYHNALICYIIRQYSDTLNYLSKIFDSLKLDHDYKFGKLYSLVSKLAILTVPFDSSGHVKRYIYDHLHYADASIKPYLQLTFHIEKGNLSLFYKLFDLYRPGYTEDRLFIYFDFPNMNKILFSKFLQKLSSLYSEKSISLTLLSDCLNLVCTKLYKNNGIIYPICKAIKDGIIDGTINYDKMLLNFKSQE